MKRSALKMVLLGAIAAGVWLLLQLALVGAPTEAQGGVAGYSTLAGADLTAEISIEPSLPAPGEQITVTIVVRNVGDASAGSFRYYFYDNLTAPPGPTTPGYSWGLFALPAGDSNIVKRNTSFGSAGCDHRIYVWVDRDNQVSESNETNNLIEEQVCVGVTCDDDAYEAGGGDDTCGAAGWLLEGATQSHTLCPDGDPGPADEDWLKFTATTGVSYTIEAGNLGSHADPLLELYSTCSGISQFGTGPVINWKAPASGLYFVRVRHSQPTHGPLAGYDLTLSTSGSPGDLFEPDNTCATARDIPTDGTPQTHLFETAGDEDWVKFAINSGDTFVVVADNTTAGTNPLISLYSSCGQPLGGALDQSGQISTTASSGQMYYAKVVNENPDSYGPNKRYRLRVLVIPCVGDGYEDDDSAAAAKGIGTTGETQTHNTCPIGDQDWVSFQAEAGTVYVLQTSKLGPAADTHLYLYDTDGQKELAHNDDYGYLLSSRIIWQAPSPGTYYAKVRHHNPNVAGVSTNYDLSIAKGRCKPDDFEGDNGPGEDTPLVTDGQAQTHTFCADPVLDDVSDQDWISFSAAAGEHYVIQTLNLGANSDTWLNLYDRDRATLLASNDDHGYGSASAISYTMPAAGTYYVQVIHYNSTYFGGETGYQIAISGTVVPPTPPTLPPAQTPPSTQTGEQTEVVTLIAVNRERFSTLYSTAEADALMAKLYELADHSAVQGVVIQVENNAAVAAAYDAWTADGASLLNTDKANAVSSAVRNLLISFLDANANVDYIVLVGDDRVIPFRRVPEGDLDHTEDGYAASLTISSTQWAAFQENMILTDDYYGDREPIAWGDHELYIPDYAVGRLIEKPSEIGAFIDAFLADDQIDTAKVLVTGYDFVQDGANAIRALMQNDEIPTVDDDLIGYSWTGSALRDRHLSASPRFDVHSINGHSTHTATGAPDTADIQASEIATATSDLAGALIFSVGCHAGLNDPGTLDLAQAFAQKKANYVGNTGYGWGGGGVIYSEALMRNYARELLRGTSTHIGPALAAAKQRYYAQVQFFDAYDQKVMMQATLYGLPMYGLTSGGTLGDDDPFPSASVTSTAPSSFGDLGVGGLDYGMAGAFGETTGGDGTALDLDGWSQFSAGQPVQPRFFANVLPSATGALHGALFLGGTYSDTPAFNPVIALPFNEYVTSTAEPSFEASGWYPPVPFQVQASRSVSTTAQTLSTVLGQYDGGSGTERVYSQMSFGTYFSDSPDTMPPIIDRVDGVVTQTLSSGLIKVEAIDISGITRVVVAYTAGDGTWYSRDLTYDGVKQKWTGTIPYTAETRYFAQVVDGAGNVAVDDNKGLYLPLSLPIPLIEPEGVKVYLPVVMKDVHPATGSNMHHLAQGY